MIACTRGKFAAESERTTGFGVPSKPLDLERVLPFVNRVWCARPGRSSK